MTPKVIYQDSEILVIDKPSGWITNWANTTGSQPVVEDWIAKNYQLPIFNFQEFRHGIVHRLDKETSGLLLIAKTKESFENLQRQFKERIIEKRYMALVHGRLKQSFGLIDASVGRLPWRRDRFGVLPNGREATTGYKVIKYIDIKNEKFTLLELKPKTGRTHQIRIHLKHIGHPIVGDEFYAGRKTARQDRKWCGRLFLHAGYIKFVHPKTLNVLEINSDLPQDLNDILQKLS